MTWIFLSPHFDDVVYSCGGLIWEQTRGGQRIEIWTVCGGGPPSGESGLSSYARGLHERWQAGPDAFQSRAEEDRQACLRLRAVYRHLSIPDCIYRFRSDPGAGSPLPIVQSDEDLFDPAIFPEADLVDRLAEDILGSLPPGGRLVSPLAIGNHLDHRLTLAAAQKVWEKLDLPHLFYADAPYVMKQVDQIADLSGMRLRALPAEIGEEALSGWQDASLAYRSQMSSFWETETELRQAFSDYCARGGGRLYQSESLK